MRFNKVVRSFRKIIIAVTLCVVGMINIAVASDESLSNDSVVINVSNENAEWLEVASNVFDSNYYTKWLAFENTAWLTFQLEQTAKITSYSMTSANDAQGRDPTDWSLQGSNDGVNWINVDNQVSQIFSTRHQTKTYTVDHQSAYKIYRLNITKNLGDKYTQLAELSIIGDYSTNPTIPNNNNVLTDINSESITYSDQIHAGEAAIKLFDDSVSTKWLARDRTAWVAYELNQNAIVSGYQLTSANDAQGRDPKDWTLEGSNDGNQWTTLDTQTNQFFTDRFSTNSYQLNNSQSFSIYRLNISGNRGDSLTQLAELSLIGEYATPPTPTTPPSNQNVLTDINSETVTYSDQIHSGEGAIKLFDESESTKWLARDSSAWVSYQLTQDAIVSGYKLTSANDAQGRDPKNWTLEGSNDGNQWITLDTQSNQSFTDRFSTNSYQFSNSQSFSFYRLNISSNRGDSYTQLAELSLLGEYVTNPPTPSNDSVLTDIDNGTVTYSDQIHSGEGAIKLFDDSISTKWLARDSSAWVTYQFTRNAIVSGYTLTSANDAQGRDPKDWTLEGSNNGNQWTTLDTQTNQNFAERFSTNNYQLNNRESFSFYRLNISSNRGDTYTQLAELELIGQFSDIPLPPLPPLEASFTAEPTNIFIGDQVQYSAPDNMDSYSWQFEGGSPSESSAQNPTVFYPESGYFDTSLTLTKGNQEDSHLKQQFIVVSEKPSNNIDITSDSGVMRSQYGSTISGEGLNELTDDILSTKYLVKSSSSWVEHKGDQNYIVNAYSITSGNDSPPRDPLEWTLEGSNDGINFTVIDSQSNQDWVSRSQTREFSFSNNTAYRFHRFNFSNNGLDEYGLDILQIAELAILGYGAGGEYPTAIMNFNNVVTEGDSVTLSSEGSRNVASLLWQVEGQANSNQATPTYTFNQSGSYAVTLTVTTAQGETDIATGTIRVNKVGSGNGDFVAPNIDFIDEDPTHPGSIIFKEMVPDPVLFIQEHSETLAKLIYDDVTPNIINNVENITYRLHDYDGISGKSGATPNIYISLSSRYIAEKSQELNGETNAILTEIRGVLYHELTHGYQWEPVGAGGYAGGTEFFGFIEGLADYNRITLGFHPEAVARTGGSYTSGYTTTAFFYVWLEQAYNIERFGAKLNATANTIAPWTLEKALQEIFTNEGLQTKTLSNLWSEYQNSL